jgi:hypothetical protein
MALAGQFVGSKAETRTTRELKLRGRLRPPFFVRRPAADLVTGSLLTF